MSFNKLPVHRTLTRSLSQSKAGGWEFFCPLCGYQAHYVANGRKDTYRLEIVQLGDPEARHTSGQNIAGAGFHALDQEIEEEEWLTPELRFKLEEILRNAGLDD